MFLRVAATANGRTWPVYKSNVDWTPHSRISNNAHRWLDNELLRWCAIWHDSFISRNWHSAQTKMKGIGSKWEYERTFLGKSAAPWWVLPNTGDHICNKINVGDVHSNAVKHCAYLFAGTSILKMVTSEAPSAFPSPCSLAMISFSDVCERNDKKILWSKPWQKVGIGTHHIIKLKSKLEAKVIELILS
jgi:hypothetical protein